MPKMDNGYDMTVDAARKFFTANDVGFFNNDQLVRLTCTNYPRPYVMRIRETDDGVKFINLQDIPAEFPYPAWLQ